MEKTEVREAPLRGLASGEVEESRRKHGANKLTPPRRTPWWVQLLEKFKDPLIVILVVAAIISLIPVILVPGHSWVESAGIIGAVLLATVVGFINEFRAAKEFDILNQVSDTTPVRVIRDGKHQRVPKNELVVGDIVLLETGEEIPADGEVLEAVAFRVNQSSLTGESEPVVKKPQAKHGIHTASQAPAGAYADHIALRSTTVTEGHAIIRITHVGDATEIGKVAHEAGGENAAPSPLHLQLESLSQGINVFGFSVAFILFATLIVHGVLTGHMEMTPGQWGVFGAILGGMGVIMLRIWYPVLHDLLGYMHIRIPVPGLVTAPGFRPWLICLLGGLALFGAVTSVLLATGAVAPEPAEWLPAAVGDRLLLYFMIAITLIVVAVPEGLPMSVTLSLAYSMRKMARQNNLVRRMHACETIGAATVVCSDKTGTLTLNRMTVRGGEFPGTEVNCPASVGMQLLAEAVSANSTADLSEDGSPLGNVTEGAMLMWLKDIRLDYSDFRTAFRIIDQLPFSTKYKYMATLGLSAITHGRVLYVKGAPELVLERCASTHLGELTPEARAYISASIAAAQRQAMRVIGIAYKREEQETASFDLEDPQGLVWLGFFAIQDPVRPDVPAAVATCQGAGVSVKIVTGDNFETACQIGREIGLLPAEGEIDPKSVMTGVEFGGLGDDELAAHVNDLRVLSRARPMDKLRLVRALQRQGHVVAVTGDGTNDAPALSHADVGLSMGVTGTAVAKEASDIVLLDDSFSSICKAIQWGRSLYRNIQKFIVFQLTVNVAACGVAALGPFTGVELPLTVTQMLWVNLIMDTLAALALATEPPSEDVLQQKPRSKEAFIITPSMWKWILGMGLPFVLVLMLYIPLIPDEAANPTAYAKDVTILFTVFVMLQFWNLFNARMYGSTASAFKGLAGNPLFLLIAAIVLVGQIIAVQFGNDIFRTVPLSLTEWLVISAATFPVLIIGEIARKINCKL